MDKKIGIIGMGHMGQTLYNGLLRAGYEKEKIGTSNSAADNASVIDGAEWIILTVKTGQIKDVLSLNKDRLHTKILISAAAGVTTKQLEEYTGDISGKIARIMPNVPAAYNQGVIGLWTNQNIDNKEKIILKTFFDMLGTVIICSTEDELNAITIVAACAPAFIAYFINSLAKAGAACGLEAESAQAVAFKTFAGTITYLQQTNKTPQELQTAVATKGGLTEKIIKQMEREKMEERFMESLVSGYDTIKLQK